MCITDEGRDLKLEPVFVLQSSNFFVFRKVFTGLFSLIRKGVVYRTEGLDLKDLGNLSDQKVWGPGTGQRVKTPGPPLPTKRIHNDHIIHMSPCVSVVKEVVMR